MKRSLLERCHQVESFLKQKQDEKLRHAKEILSAADQEKFAIAVRYLESELRMHQEVRTLWPYLLAIPDSEEAARFCELYGCKLEELGDVLQTRINQLNNTLEVIDDKMLNAGPLNSFWESMRTGLLKRICFEAEQTVGQQPEI